MANFLKKPFPAIPRIRQRLMSTSFLGLFIFLFLYTFKPFGIANIHGSILLVTLGYGLITFLTMLVVQLGAVTVFSRFYNEDKWTVGRELLHTLLIVVLVAIGNLFFSVYLGFFSLSFKGFLVFLCFTVAVGIFPIFLQILIRQNAHQRHNLRTSQKMSEGLQSNALKAAGHQLLELQNEEGRAELHLEKDQLLVMESADNYVQVYFLKEGNVKSQLIRNTLKFFEEQFNDDPLVFRCHRSYLVNLHKLQKVDGNARGYLLQLHDDFREIPVSRRKIEAFSELLNAELNGPVYH